MVYFEKQLILSDALDRFQQVGIQWKTVAERLLDFLDVRIGVDRSEENVPSRLTVKNGCPEQNCSQMRSD